MHHMHGAALVVVMSSFTEKDHPRTHTGRFAAKTHSSPFDELTADELDAVADWLDHTDEIAEEMEAGLVSEPDFTAIDRGDWENSIPPF